MRVNSLVNAVILLLLVIFGLFPFQKAFSQFSTTTVAKDDKTDEEKRQEQEYLRIGLERYSWVDTELDKCELKKEESDSGSQSGSGGSASESTSAPIQPSGDLGKDIVDRINENKDVYVEAGEKTNVPWQLLAAVHYREASLKPYNPSNGDGAYGIVSKHYPPKDKLSREEFLQQSIDAGEFLQGKVQSNLSNHRTPLQKENTDPEVIKDTLYSYNGRAGAYAAQAAALGFDPSTQPYEGSPYVMNKFDEKRQNMGIITRDGGSVSGQDTRYGAFTIYSKIAGMSGACGAKETGLKYPPNLGQPNELGYYQMPEPTNDEYKFSGGACPAQRWGSKELVGVIYTVAVNWKNKYPNSRLVVGDLNASGHKSHKWGVAVDITVSDNSAAIIGKTEGSVELGKVFVNTGLIKSIWFDDVNVNNQVKAYADSIGKPIIMESIGGHGTHFHVNIQDQFKGPVSEPGC
ncbi:MAG: hypothetical protein Q8P54_01810 [bacterium]|nr:hypothetical protein [bacterium]